MQCANSSAELLLKLGTAQHQLGMVANAGDFGGRPVARGSRAEEPCGFEPHGREHVMPALQPAMVTGEDATGDGGRQRATYNKLRAAVGRSANPHSSCRD